MFGRVDFALISKDRFTFRFVCYHQNISLENISLDVLMPGVVIASCDHELHTDCSVLCREESVPFSSEDDQLIDEGLPPLAEFSDEWEATVDVLLAVANWKVVRQRCEDLAETHEAVQHVVRRLGCVSLCSSSHSVIYL